MRKANLFLATLLTVMGGVDAMADTQTFTGFTWDANNQATIPLECLELTMTKGTGSYTIADGVATLTTVGSTDEGDDNGKVAGTLSVKLPADGIDMSMVDGLTVDHTVADGPVTHCVNIEGVNGWYTSQYGISNAYTQYFSVKGSCVKKIEWVIDDACKPGALTIRSITLTKSSSWIDPNDVQVRTSLPGLTDITKDLYNDTGCALNLNTSTDLYYGTDVAGKYADLTIYNKLQLTIADNDAPRIIIYKSAEDATSGSQVICSALLEGYGSKVGDVYIFNIAKYCQDNNCKFFVKTIKSSGWGQKHICTRIQLQSESAYSLELKGSGPVSDGVKSVLADETLTSIDATGLDAAVSEALVLGNPNCLITVKDASYVKNTKNVVVIADAGTTCADLDLTDAKPFKAPVAFTATSAKFSKTLDANLEGYSTLVLPFAATTSATAYNATGIEANGYTITLAATNNIAAGKPVIVKGEAGAALNITAQNAAIATNDAMTNGLLTGTYAAATHAPTGSYVLQHQDELTAFYQVAEDAVLTAAPFRAWLTAPAGQQNAPKFVIAGDATGINNIEAAEAGATVRAYNLAGQTVNNNAKGIQIRRTQSGRVVKVAVK